MGLLEDGLLHSPFGLTEVRVLYEIAHRTAPTASAIGQELGLDPGYLSRLLQRLRKAGLVSATAAAGDRRQRLLGLTARGRRTFGALDARSSREVAVLLGRLTPASRRRLVTSMRQVEETALASALSRSRVRRCVRPGPGRPGVGGAAARRALRARVRVERGVRGRWWPGIVAEFAARHDPQAERAWIAELDGVRPARCSWCGSRTRWPKLRLLLVEPWARGTGLGQALVRRAIEFAARGGLPHRHALDQLVLDAARGSTCRPASVWSATERHRSFGHDLTSETWELALEGE
jgi:DNA-binding MarR family transcriptional regulator